MSQDNAIIVEDLGKYYQLGATLDLRRNFREMLMEMPRSVGRRLRKRFESQQGENGFWALHDISFEVKHGEAIGIIGHNGAGKSTLLKILSRITAPTKGRAELRGRVGSLLEVGTGFHPELSGRENIYLNGSILGMRKTEIDRKFDEIVDFAGTERFLETPVKRYSSGMRVRLGFAVAAFLEPEILVVDEVLSVGDAEFRHKCLGKMQEVTRGGRTVLFVSHNLTAVQQLCTRAIHLKSGGLMMDGAPADVVAKYTAAVNESETERNWPDPETAPGNKLARIRRIAIRSEGETYSGHLPMNAPIRIEMDVEVLEELPGLGSTLLFMSPDNTIAFSTSSLHHPALAGRSLKPGMYRYACTVPANLLNSLIYRIKYLAVIPGDSRPQFGVEDILTFEVSDDPTRRSGYLGVRHGTIAPLLDWEQTALGENLS